MLAVLRQSHFRRVLLGGPALEDFPLDGINDGDGRLAPQADKEPFAVGRERAGVGIALLAERHLAVLLGLGDGHDADGVAPGAGDEERLAVAGNRHASRDELLGGRRDGKAFSFAEQAVVELERVHDFKLAAAGVELAAVGEAEAIEGLIEVDPADDARGLEIDDHDLVLAIAAVNGSQPATRGVEGEIDRKVAELHLLAGRAEQPLVGHLDGAVGANTRKEPGGGGCRRGAGFASCFLRSATVSAVQVATSAAPASSERRCMRSSFRLARR